MHWFHCLVWTAVVACATAGLNAAEITLKDGRVLKGTVAEVTGVAEQPNPASTVPAQVVLIDSGLTRSYIAQRQIQNINPAEGDRDEKFRIDQQIQGGGARINSVGPIINITAFDEYGRRTITMSTNVGRVDVIQGIVEITPLWTEVKALRKYDWKQRIATSSIPRETLNKILYRNVDAKNAEQRLKIVRLYLQGNRYQDASRELEQIVAEFPESKERFEGTVLRLRQLSAQRLLAESKLRRVAGQHRLTYTMLDKFPSENVAGELLQEVSELLDGYHAIQQRARTLLSQLDANLKSITDEKLRQRLEPMVAEIKSEMNINTIDRLAAFQQFADANELTADQKIALAISGWVLGKDGGTENVGVALSVFEVRNLLGSYLREPVKNKRAEIFRELASKEGANPVTVAKVLAHMKPPLETPEPQSPGCYELTIPGIGQEGPLSYLVQLPPEYDPYRRYPAIVTLHGAGTKPEHQIDWWAGAQGADGTRLGQATRYGYVVIAPRWGKEHQFQYGFTAVEHAAALNSLRDACKRFSIDTDRVFLSGHSMGGDAAWDIGLSHPDLWAGVIPIVAVADKYCAHYWPNARDLPLYFVCGELDGDKMVRNSQELDRYLTKIGYNAMVAEFLGRGHENFSDEILNLFDWMNRYRRNFFPRRFETASMRSWDNYFWWLELADFPERSLVNPVDWPKRGARAISTEASIGANNSIHVKTGAGQVSVWLSPDLVDFNQPVRMLVNGGRLSGEPFIQPDLAVMLEDVRTRGDRQHPFWAKVETASGRRVATNR
jgi:predicted esterase